MKIDRIKIRNIKHAIEIIFYKGLKSKFEEEFGVINDNESLSIPLGQLVDFLNRHRRPDELYYIREHWLETLLDEFGFVSRYQLQQLGGPRQSTTANWIERKTKFKSIPAEQIHKLVYAICNLDPKYDYVEVLHKLFDEYLERNGNE